MESIVLEVFPRDKEKKAKDLRIEKLVPIIFYGKGKENRSFQADYQVFRKVFLKAGWNTVIDLKVEGEKDSIKVLVVDLQFDPVYSTITHVDLKFVDMTKEVTAEVPVELTGDAPAVRELAGILSQTLSKVEVKCLPANLPHSLEASIDMLIDFNSVVHVKDIVVPADVEIVTDSGLTIATVSAPKEEEVDTVAPDGAAGTAGEEAGSEEGAKKSEEGAKKEEGK